MRLNLVYVVTEPDILHFTKRLLYSTPSPIESICLADNLLLL